MSKTQSTAKRQRRAYELWLKKTNPAAYKEWKSQSIQRGIQLQNAQSESVRKMEEEHLEKIQTDMIVKMKAEGKTDAEIDQHIAIWVKTLKIWGSNERPMRFRDAMKEFNAENTKPKVDEDDNN